MKATKSGGNEKQNTEGKTKGGKSAYLALVSFPKVLSRARTIDSGSDTPLVSITR